MNNRVTEAKTQIVDKYRKSTLLVNRGRQNNFEKNKGRTEYWLDL